ncbi:MAG TPA: two-component regulator propeller domain-containing protein [Saprospiraceae bacterium]|nr:two-component regulator propeller domain-containing protein [Saprospiraceae bacterium]
MHQSDVPALMHCRYTLLKGEAIFKFLIVCVWLGTIVPISQAQSFPEEEDFVLYSVKDGLPDNAVRTIEQDNQGYIWAGTHSGLSCFDGMNFTNYYSSEDLSTSLPSDFIYNLTKRTDGKIYVGTFNGLSVLDPIKRSFTSVRVPGINSLAKNANSFEFVCLLPNGDLVAGSSVGIFVFEENLKLVFQYVHYHSSDVGKVRMQFTISMLPLSDGNCLIEGYKGLYLYHTYEHRLEKIETPLKYSNDYYVMKSIGIKDLALFHGTSTASDTFVITDMIKGTLGKTTFPTSEIPDFNWAVQYQLIYDSLFLISSHFEGLILATLDQKTLTFKINSPKRFRSYHFRSVFLDNEKRIWLGSQYGLLVQSFTRQHFRHYPLAALKDEYGIQPYIHGITKIKEHFYVGITDQGVWEFDNNFIHTKPVPSLASKNIWNLGSWNSDTLYAGTQWGLFFLTEDSNPLDLQQIGPGGSTFYQYQDRQGHIWAGFHGGVLRYDPLTGEKLIWTAKDSTHYFPFNDARGITETDSGYIWMCGDGWHRWNPFKMIFDQSYTALPGTEGQAGIAYNVASNGKEDLIFSINLNGIWKWTPGTKAEKLSIANRSFQYVEEIFPDPAPHCFWLVLKSGIGFLNVETGQYRFFNEISGLPAGEVIHGFFLDTKTDTMYIGMDNGVLAFRRSDFAFSSKKPSVFITGMSLINNGVFLDISNVVTLDPSDRDFSIQFSCPEYEYASNIRYEYRLSNQTWTEVGSVHSVQFANLGAGKYQFEVRGSSPNGVIGDPATLMFSILPFYYETWWFRLIILFFIVALIYIWFKRRLVQLQKIERMRQSIAADLHDEVGASLTSVQILAELAGQHKDPVEQTEVLSRLKTQSKKATSSLREIVWNIQPKNDLLEIFLGELTRYAGEVLEDAGITYTLHADQASPHEKLSLSSRQQLARVFKESLSNLIRHSKATHVDISFMKEGNQLVLILQDNGVGFDLEKTNRGNGLNNMTERMKMIKGNISIQSTHNLGTKIKFSCKLI